MRLSPAWAAGICWTGIIFVHTTCAAQEQHNETVSICSLLENPRAYENKKISIRGSVYIGMENTNISDRRCPGKTIELNVGNDVYGHPDIREFHRKITHWKMHGTATVSGIFTVSDSQLKPYALNVEKVRNVTRTASD